jgi:tripartite-type tricarboxylate transporter receptor subunit TctC
MPARKFSQWLMMIAAMVLLCASTAAAPAFEQSFPKAPVRLIVSTPAGGVNDVIARLVADGLSALWGQPVIVDNRPGGNHAVSAVAVERSAPDGHTLLVSPDTIFTANPYMIERLAYTPKNFTPIMVLCSITPMLVVNDALPIRSVKELIAYAKSKPGGLSYGSFGSGTYAHLSMEDLKQRAGVDIGHVPYRGAAPAATDLLAGNISMMFINLSMVDAHEGPGKVRIIAAGGDSRAPTRPELPTISQAGVPGFSTSAWFGLFGPASMPGNVVRKIHADVDSVLDSKATQEFFREQSLNRVDLSAEGMRQLMERDSAHWAKLIKSLGIKLN